MDVGEFIRERIRQARNESGLTQRRMAKLLGISQSAVSDIERGRVQINAKDLAQVAKLLKRPIAYFYPADLETDTKQEADLLNHFRAVSSGWKTRILSEAEAVEKMHQWLVPYEQAGIPEEFYQLIWEDVEMIGWMDKASDEHLEPPEMLKQPTEEERQHFLEEDRKRRARYKAWKQQVQAEWEAQAEG